MAVTVLANFASQAEEWSPVSIDTKTVNPMPIDSGDISATRFRMTPVFSSRWIRFQQGLCDRPTRCAICASERLASSWRSATIFLSMASMISINPSSGGAVSLDRKRLQANRGAEPFAEHDRQGIDDRLRRQTAIADEPRIGAIEP